MSGALRKIGGMLNPIMQQGPVPTGVNRGMSTKYLTSMIGTPGAGKTNLAAMIFYTARTLQQQLPDFHCSIDDTNSTIKLDVCNIESGRFPPKTKAYNTYAYQCALNMWWGKNSLWGQKSATFNVCDLAGEDEIVHSQYSYKRPDPTAYSQAAKLVEYIYRSEIFILAAPASRAPVFDGDESVEKEDSDLAFNPDVNLSDIFDKIVKKRKENRQPIKGVALCLTKCDMIDKYVEAKHGWNLYNSEADRQAFINKYFPWTGASIKGLKDTWSNTQIAIFPMFIETVKNGDGSQKKWPDGSPRIDVVDRVPKYNAQGNVDLINFIGKLVG
jgi:hypothetical protein